MSQSYEGKVVLVTGGAGGMGRATALAFGQAGAAVVVADLAEEGGRRGRPLSFGPQVRRPSSSSPMSVRQPTCRRWWLWPSKPSGASTAR